MANEIKLSFNHTLGNGSLKDSFAPALISVPQASQLASSQVLPLTTSETDVAFAGVTTPGYCHIQNLDPTNFITYGPKSGASMVPFGKLKPGEAATERLASGVTLRMQADTGTCKVLIKCWND